MPINNNLAARARFIKCSTLEFFQAEVEEVQAKSIEFVENLEVQISVREVVVPDKKIIAIRLDVSYHHKNTDGSIAVVLKHASESIFRVDNFEEIFEKQDDDSFITDERVSRTFVGISLSTIRGVLLEKNANSPLRHLILPIIGNDSFEIPSRLEAISA